MKNIIHYLIAVSFALLVACESEPDTNLQDSLSINSVDEAALEQLLTIDDGSQPVEGGTTFNKYNPESGDLPSAIDILFKDTEDGTLNIPFDLDENGEIDDKKAPLKLVLNALDGFSTVAPVTTSFSSALDASYLNPANIPAGAVRMFEVGLTGFARAVIEVKKELMYGVDFIALLSSIDPTSSTLAIVPRKPLNPDTAYYIVITKNLKDASGFSVQPSTFYSLTKSRTARYEDETLETLRQLISTSETTVDLALEDLSAKNIVVSWSFTTQSVGNILTTVRGLVGTPVTVLQASEAIVVAGGAAGKSPLGAANLHEGTIAVPYYLTVPTSADLEAMNNNPWQSEVEKGGENNLTRLNPLPAVTNPSLEIPLLVTTPVDTVTYPAPWKTVIFQHGITTNRTVMLAVSDALAVKGFATVAIDMPLHGLTDTGSPLYQAGNERTFEADLVQEVAGDLVDDEIEGGDGVIDSSGKHFINLSNLLVTRDNIRQAVADLFALTAAIPAMDIDGDAETLDFDADNIYFVGHSLGAMVGTTFLALEPDVKDAVLAFGASGYAKVLDGSAAFSPTIVAGLQEESLDENNVSQIDKEASGVAVEARAAYESFLGVAQTALDTVDPANYASAAVADRGMLFFEIVGDKSIGGVNLPDIVIPNKVKDIIDLSSTVSSPTAGTDALMSFMELSQADEDQTGEDLHVSVKFTEGYHGSILNFEQDNVNPGSPEIASKDVTVVLQDLMASFLKFDGGELDITNAEGTAALLASQEDPVRVYLSVIQALPAP